MNNLKLLALLLISSLFSTTTFSQVTLKNSTDSISYSIGVNIGQNLKQQGLNPTTDLIAAAIKDVLNNNQLIMDAEQCNGYIQSYFQNIYAKKASVNQKAGEEYLAQNKLKEGVNTLPSGLQYRVLKKGEGTTKPTINSKVKVHYEGKTIDGAIFDSSLERGTPAEFGVTQVIKGWTEALQLMSAGDSWEVFIPAELAYGPQGPPAIGPNQMLIFKIELLEILSQ